MSNQNSTIKYSAIASAVALACAASFAGAATIAQPTRVDMSLQGNQAAAGTVDNVFGSNFSVQLGTTYAVNDTIVFGLIGASFRTGGSLPTQVTCNKTDSASTVVLSWLSKTTSQASLRVTAGTGLDGTGASCNFNANDFSFVRNTAVTAGASSVTLTMNSYVAGNTSQGFDATTSRTVGGVANQFSAGLGTGFSGDVDVNVDRLAWTDGVTRLTRDLVLTFSSTSATNAATGAQTTVTANVYGAAGTTMFSFLDNDGDGVCTEAERTTGEGRATVASGSLSISSNCATLTFTESGFVGTGSTNQSRTITLSKQSSSTGAQIADGSFTAAPAFSVSISSTATQSITAFAAGSFGLNGTAIVVPYMPYGQTGTLDISQAYSISNASGAAGTVTAVARNQAGVVCSLGSVGVAAARSVTNLSTAINEGIAACYGGSRTAPVSALNGTRVFLTITSNTPAADTVLTSTYNVGPNARVNVINNSMRVRTTP